MRRSFALVAVLLAVQLPYVAASQETRPSVPPRLVVFEHDAKDVTGFVLYMRGSEGALLRFDLGPLAPDASGRISAPLPVNLPNGTYRVQVAAYNLSGESARIDAEPAVTRVTWGTAPRVQPKAQPGTISAAALDDPGPVVSASQFTRSDLPVFLLKKIDGTDETLP